ncbi:MAG: hypothetical protein ABWZ18_00945 [Solirubrobacterales bacterium]
MSDRFERLERRVQGHADYALELRRLRESAAWKALAEQMEKAKEKVVERYVKVALAGGNLEQRQLDYDRGYWDGIAALLSQPERAQQQLENSLAELEKLEQRARRSA